MVQVLVSYTSINENLFRKSSNLRPTPEPGAVCNSAIIAFDNQSVENTGVAFVKVDNERNELFE